MILEETARLAYQRKQEDSKVTYRQLARELLSDPTREKELRVATDAYAKRLEFLIPLTDDTMPAEYEFHIPDPLMLDYQPTLLFADPHAPFTDVHTLRMAIDLAKARSIQRCIIAGDVFDANSLSVNKKAWEPVTNIRDDLIFGYQLLRFLTKQFKEVIVLTGNHDEWLMNAYGINAKQLFNIPGVVATQYPFLFFENYVIGHLDQYSQQPGELAAKIAAKYQAHTFVGHDHMAGIVEGSYNGVSIGSMLMADKIYYKSASFNSLPDWSNGFVVFDKQGYANCYKQQGTTAYGTPLVHMYARFI